MKKIYNLTVIVTKGEGDSFDAICPILQGCYARGETLEEALEMIKNVIKMHITSRLDNGEPIPEEVYSAQLRLQCEKAVG